MVDIEKIKNDIEKLYARTAGSSRDIPLELQAVELAHFARDYIRAASKLDVFMLEHWLPVLQLTGHAVELSLKACIAAAQSVPPLGHDLIELYRQAEALGFELAAPQFAAIVHLRHFYFQDLATGTKFKVRYPTRQDERLGGAVPTNATFTSVVDALLKQAAQRE
jgi:hypothetical protein